MDRLIALVLLRWRMDLRSLMRARERLLGLLLLVPFLLAFSIFGSIAIFFALRGLGNADPEAAVALVSGLATLAGLSWALSPLVTGVALSEALDVTRLVHFPVPVATLAGASLLANLSQPMVVAEVPILLAVALAGSEDNAHFPLALAGVMLSFALVLATAQVVGLALHGISRNRRFQDLALLLGLAVGFVLSFGPLLLLTGGGRPLRSVLRVVLRSDLFALSPFAWGVRAGLYGGRGEVGAFVGYGSLAVGGLAVAVALSVVLIRRIHRGELDLGYATKGGTARARMYLSGAIGALVEKDVRSAWRDPALKATLFMGLLGPVLFLVFLTSGGRRPGGALALAVFVGISGFGANAFGLERRGLGLLMGFPVERWRILVGKNLGSVVFRVPGLLVVALAAVLLAPPAYLPAALTLAVVTMAMAAGMDNYVSIVFPAPAPHPGQNPYGGRSSRGLPGLAIAFLLMAASALCASPFVVLVLLPLELGRWLWVFSLPLALAGAGAVYAMLVAGAARVLERRETMLLERVLEEA